MSAQGNCTREKVSFPSHGVDVVGDVYRPHGEGLFPAVVVLGWRARS